MFAPPHSGASSSSSLLRCIHACQLIALVPKPGMVEVVLKACKASHKTARQSPQLGSQGMTPAGNGIPRDSLSHQCIVGVLPFPIPISRITNPLPSAPRRSNIPPAREGPPADFAASASRRKGPGGSSRPEVVFLARVHWPTTTRLTGIHEPAYALLMCGICPEDLGSKLPAMVNAVVAFLINVSIGCPFKSLSL